jgi:hypothetical protein
MTNVTRKEDLDKPAVEVQDAGLTDAQAAAAWREAAFAQAKRANGLSDALRGIRDQINELLKVDERRDE